MIAFSLVAIVIIAGFAWHAVHVAHAAMKFARENKCQSVPPTREERIAFYRGQILACRAIEETISDSSELPAMLLLAVRRGEAAQAREALRALGIEA